MATEQAGSLLYLEHAEYTPAECSRCGLEVFYLRINRAIKNVFTMLMVDAIDAEDAPGDRRTFRPHQCRRATRRPDRSRGENGRSGRIGGDS